MVVRDAGAAGLLVSAVREEQRLCRGVLMGDLVRPAAPQTAVEHVHDARAGLGVGLVDILCVLDAAPRVRQRVVPCLLYTSPSPRDATLSRMPSSA